MVDINLEVLKKKSFQGVIALTSRTFVLQLIAFGATFLLTIFLSPATFGVFYVVSAVIAFLNYFSDIGLAAALIQKKDELTRSDLITTFTIQQLLVGLGSLIALGFSSWVAHFYKLDTAGVWLFRSLVLAFFLSSLKTIPSVLLERKLEFHLLVVPQILETIGFYAVAVILAVRGFGITSFTWAVLVRAILGLVAIYVIFPWKIGFGIDVVVAKRLLRFGVPFQLNSFLALLKDDLLTVFLGKVLTFTEVGYIGWAKKWAEVPLRLIMDSVIRVTFPAFSRLQHTREILGRAIEKTLFGISTAIFPITVGLLFFVEPLVKLIPRYGKWEPALFAFYVFAVSSAIVSISTPLTNALNAVGKIKITLWLMVLWTVGTWVMTISFIKFFGFNGVPLALGAITGTVILVVKLAQGHADFSVWRSIKSALFGSLTEAGVFVLLFQLFPQPPVWGLVVVGLLGVSFYALVVWQLEKVKITDIFKFWQGGK